MKRLIGIAVMVCCCFSIAYAVKYPSLMFDGYLEGKYSLKQTRPLDSNRAVIESDGVYKKLPWDLQEGSGRYEQTLKLRIDGKLSQELSVAYDIEQQPDFPAKYDISVTHGLAKLTFFNFSSEITDTSYTNLSKALNGVMFNTQDENWKINLAYGRERSEPKKTIFKGSGATVYNIGQTSLLEGSVKVWVNDNINAEVRDYSIDYTNGKITFKTAKTSNDFIKVLYEFTNPVEDLIPILSAKSITMARVKYTSEEPPPQTFIDHTQKYEAIYLPAERPPLPPAYLLMLKADLVPDAFFYKRIICPPPDLLHIGRVIATDGEVTNSVDVENMKLDANDSENINEIEIEIENENESEIDVNNSDTDLESTEIISENIQQKVTPLQPYFSTMVMPELNNQSISMLTGLPDYFPIDPIIQNGLRQNTTGEGSLPVKDIYQELAELSTLLASDVDQAISDDDLFTGTIEDTLPPIIPTRTFQLANAPIEPGTEIVHLNDTILKRDVDYSIRYREGELLLQRVTLFADDALWIEYKYQESAITVNVIDALDTQGPYYLEHNALVRNSESVVVNDIGYYRDIDYRIDYETGKLLFTFPVERPKQIQVTYKYFVQKLSRAELERLAAKKKPLSVGFTYINERARPIDDELTVLVSSETPLVSGNQLILAYNPIDPSSSFEIIDTGASSGSSSVTGSLYTIDYYQGEITFIPTDGISSTANLRVSYSYKNSYLTEVFFQPDGRDSEYTNSDIVYRELPMKYQGEDVSIIGGEFASRTRLDRGEEYTLEYADDGHAPKIRFIRYDQDHLSSALHNVINSNYQIRMKYYFAPDEVPDLGNLDHTLVGIDTEAYLPNNIHVIAELAYSQKNFSRPTELTTVTMNGSGGDNASYSLGRSSIYEDSEEVFLNDVLQTKDQDYIINYSSGTLKFRNKTPGSSDLIEINYKYFSSSTGIATVGNVQEGSALRVAADYNTGGLKLTTRIETVGEDFQPVGSIPEAQGTTLWGVGCNYDFTNDSAIRLSFDQRRAKIGVKDDNAMQLKQSDSGLVAYKARPFGLASLDYTYSFGSVIQDNASVLIPTPSTETFENTHQVKLETGPKQFVTSIEAKTNQKKDLISGTNVINNLFSAANTFTPERIWGLKSFGLTTKYSNNQDINVVTSYRKSVDSTGFNLSISPISKVQTNLEYTFNSETVQQLSGGLPTTSISEVQNRYFRIAYNPWSWISMGYDYKRKGSHSPLSAQEPDIENAENFRISSFQPYACVVDLLNLDKDNLLAPIKGSNLAISIANSGQSKDNSYDLSNTHTQKITYSSIRPFSFLNISQTSLENSNSLAQKLRSSSSASNNLSATEVRNFGTGLSFTPDFIFLFDKCNYALSISDKSEQRSTTRSAVVTDDADITLANTFTRGQAISYTPGSLYLWPTGLNLGSFSTGWTEAFSSNQNRSTDRLYNRDTGIPSDNISLDSSEINQEVYNLSYSPLNLFSSSGKWTKSNSYYNRNKSSSASGCNVVDLLQRDISAGWSPFSIFNLTGTYATLWEEQHTTANIDIPKAVLLNDLTSVVDKYTRNIKPTLTFSPFALLKLSGGYELDYISQSQIAYGVLVTNNQVASEATVIGIGLYPEHLIFIDLLKNFVNTFAIKYDLKYRKLKANDIDMGTGIGRVLNVSWAPTLIPGMNIVFNYNQSENAGKGMNSLSSAAAKQSANSIILTEIQDVDDTTIEGSAKINIKVPIDTAVITSIVVEGEWNKKVVIDRMDSSHDYSIDAFLVTGRVNF